MKKILSTILVLCSLCAAGQNNKTIEDDLYYSPAMKAAVRDTAITRTDIQNMQINLRRYRDQRQAGYILSLASLLSTGTAVTLYDRGNEYTGKAFIVSGALSIVSVITFWDAEKWLKKASVSISPTSLKINF